MPAYRDPAEIFQVIDNWPKALRELVYEYGFVIVEAMVDDGYSNPRELRGYLETWRSRRQEGWLASDYITERVVRGFKDHFMQPGRAEYLRSRHGQNGG